MFICLNRGTAGAGLPLDQFVHLAADSGFAGADVDLTYGRIQGVAALRELYLAANLRFGGWGPGFDWRGDERKQSDGLAELALQAQIAAKLGIDSCCTYILPASELPFMENWNFHVSRLQPIAAALAEYGLRFGLEFVAPHHLRKQWPHEFIFTAGQMLELADDVGENAGLLVDSFHVYASGEPFDIVAKLPSEKIVLAHLNDAPAGPPSALKDFERLLPGAGALDLPAFLRALDASGYTGPVSLEVFSPVLKKLPPEQAAKQAWDATANLLQKAGWSG
jgi:sugar phosphate isomerase/epimerase